MPINRFTSFILWAVASRIFMSDRRTDKQLNESQGETRRPKVRGGLFDEDDEDDWRRNYPKGGLFDDGPSCSTEPRQAPPQRAQKRPSPVNPPLPCIFGDDVPADRLILTRMTRDIRLTELSWNRAPVSSHDADQFEFTLDTKRKRQPLNEFGLNVMKSLARPSSSFLFSPISAYAVLAMTSVLFTGETRAEIVFGTLQEDESVSNEEICEHLRELIDSETGGCVESYNRIWWNERIPFPLDVSALMRVSEIAVERAEFPEPARSLINQAVSASTNGQIPEAIDELLEEQSMVLVNAVHFSSKWVRPFSPAGEKKWTNADGGSHTAEYMELCDFSTPYLRKQKHEYVSIPYDHGYSMVICLPVNQGGGGVNALDITPHKFLRDIEELTKQTIDIVMPKFAFETESMDLIPAMRELGVSRAFCSDAVDGYCIDAFVQKAKILVDEYHTEAAACTFALVRKGEKVRFVANHPFVYAIRHDKTGALAFIGYVSEPRFPGHRTRAVQ